MISIEINVVATVLDLSLNLFVCAYNESGGLCLWPLWYIVVYFYVLYRTLTGQRCSKARVDLMAESDCLFATHRPDTELLQKHKSLSRIFSSAFYYRRSTLVWHKSSIFLIHLCRYFNQIVCCMHLRFSLFECRTLDDFICYSARHCSRCVLIARSLAILSFWCSCCSNGDRVAFQLAQTRNRESTFTTLQVTEEAKKWKQFYCYYELLARSSNRKFSVRTVFFWKNSL